VDIAGAHSQGYALLYVQHALAVVKIVEQLLTSQGLFAGPQILCSLRDGGALGRHRNP
jgi:hypothetical protein